MLLSESESDRYTLIDKLGGTAENSIRPKIRMSAVIFFRRYALCVLLWGMTAKTSQLEKFEKSFEQTVSRGPDDTRIVQLDSAILGFHRLAIMGLSQEGMQPFFFG